ncbi:MAG: hypothetical protein HAW59_03630 [Betaproteobacteria bacterium]|nr:hypothetical protein [Betaproteobacteria bacterium]
MDTTLQLWGIIGTWVAGIGTLSAVIVSLWLAWDKRQVKLEISATLGFATNLGQGVNKFLWIRVVNAGSHPARIKKYALEEHRGKKKNHLLLLDNGNIILVGELAGIDGIASPKIISSGEDTNFQFPFSKLVAAFAENGCDEKDIRKTKVVVSTSLCEFTEKIEKDFMDELIKEVMANRK